MPRFFFHMENGARAEDDYGDPCDSLQQAKSYAEHVAVEVGRNKPDDAIRDTYILVTDEDGKEVFRTPVVNRGSTKPIKGSLVR